MAKRDEHDKARRGKIKAKSLATRITGFSVPVIGGGLQWAPTEPERETVRKLLSFLEDRRALYAAYCLEIWNEVVQSVLRIRDELAKALQSLPDVSNAIGSVKAMRAACRKFLTEPHPEFMPTPLSTIAQKRGKSRLLRSVGRTSRDPQCPDCHANIHLRH
ncbi:MAG TPA: hypothetical protein DD670_01650 [Planctomycetaceae bacterium]|nr:hypothetical protein [Planctomycetaceae bacterium]